MRYRFILVMVLIVACRHWCSAEDMEASPASDDAGEEPTAPVPVHSGKEAFWKGWKQLPKDLLRDQKQMWLFPISVARGQHLKPTLAVSGATAVLIALDGYPARSFENRKSFGTFNKVFSSSNTAKANYLIPLALYGIGVARRDSYAQKTFLLAGEAVLTSEVLTSVMKDTDRRINPSDVPVGGNYSDTWFKNKFAQNLIGGNGSFPSGHTIAAFSVATVYAERYSQHRWVRWLAYGLASVDGFSRISLKSHFGSEVFLGGALGYFLAHQVVKDAR